MNEERKQNISTNQIAPFGLAHKSHDANNNAQRNQNTANAFCHSSCHKQSHSFSLVNSKSNSNSKLQNSKHKNIQDPKNITIYSNTNSSNLPDKQKHPLPFIPKNYYLQYSPKINVVTRNRPNLNTFDRQITKRARRIKTTTMSHNLLDNSPTKNTPTSVATQTDNTPPTSNLGQGREPIDENKHAPLFEFENETAPNYRLNLSRVIGEEFLAEATLKDKNLQNIIRLVKNHNWDQLKPVSRYYYNLRNDLAVARSGCLLYDGKLVIPHQLQNLVINAVHRTHPGQVGMIRLANLIWFPQIHRTIALRAKNCKQCLDQGKNLKPIISKSKLGTLPKLSEPNEELQLDFAGPIIDKKTILMNIIYWPR